MISLDMGTTVFDKFLVKPLSISKAECVLVPYILLEHLTDLWVNSSMKDLGSVCFKRTKILPMISHLDFKHSWNVVLVAEGEIQIQLFQ